MDQEEDSDSESKSPNAGKIKRAIDDLDPELKEEYPYWRLIIEKVASMKELDTHYTFKDMMKANAVLDVKNKITSLSVKVPEKN